MNPGLVSYQFGVFICYGDRMKIRILKTRDFRGTLGMRHAGEIMETEDIELVKQLEAQGLAIKLNTILHQSDKKLIKEE